MITSAQGMVVAVAGQYAKRSMVFRARVVMHAMIKFVLFAGVITITRVPE